MPATQSGVDSSKVSVQGRRFSRLCGFTFAWISAFVAHYLAKDGAKAFMPLILLALLAISYVTRPANRQWQAKTPTVQRLGGLFFLQVGVPIENYSHRLNIGVFNLGNDYKSLAIFGYVIAHLLRGGINFARMSLE